MTHCQDCGDEVHRRTRCSACGQLLCGWCAGHAHAIARSALRHQAVCDLVECIHGELCGTSASPVAAMRQQSEVPDGD